MTKTINQTYGDLDLIMSDIGAYIEHTPINLVKIPEAKDIKKKWNLTHGRFYYLVKQYQQWKTKNNQH